MGTPDRQVRRLILPVETQDHPPVVPAGGNIGSLRAAGKRRPGTAQALVVASLSRAIPFRTLGKATGQTGQAPHASRQRAWASPDPPEGQPPRLPVPMTAAPEAGWAAGLGDSLRAPGPGVLGAPTKARSSRRPHRPRAGGVASTQTSPSAPDRIRGNQPRAVESWQGTAGGSLEG